MSTVEVPPRVVDRPVTPLAPGRQTDFGPAIRILGAAVIATAAAALAVAFRSGSSTVHAFLSGEAGLSAAAAMAGERVVTALVLFASISAVLWRCWPLFVPTAVYVFAEALARWHAQPHGAGEWVLLAHSARYVSPLVAVLLVFAGSRRGAVRERLLTTAEWGLRCSLAAVFACHGAEALSANPVFIGLITHSAANLIGLPVADSTARTALEIIGATDLAVAGVLFIRPGRLVLAWAAGWAAVTALSRVTANGWAGYPDVLVRASYYLAPVALWWLMARRSALAVRDGAIPAVGATSSGADEPRAAS